MSVTTSTPHSGNTDFPRAISRESADWPEFAPGWADYASIEPAEGTVTFGRDWSIPGAYRDVEPLVVVRVEQEFTGTAGALASGAPRVAAGPGTLWTDHRAERVAATLRAIADALAPQHVGGDGDGTPGTGRKTQ